MITLARSPENGGKRAPLVTRIIIFLILAPLIGLYFAEVLFP